MGEAVWVVIVLVAMTIIKMVINSYSFNLFLIVISPILARYLFGSVHEFIAPVNVDGLSVLIMIAIILFKHLVIRVVSQFKNK